MQNLQQKDSFQERIQFQLMTPFEEVMKCHFKEFNIEKLVFHPSVPFSMEKFLEQPYLIQVKQLEKLPFSANAIQLQWYV